MAETEKTRERELDRSTDGSGRVDDDRAPDTPTDLEGRSWFGTLKRTGREFKEDNLTDWAAALTYYGVLAIFPALLALVSLLGIFGDSVTQPLIDNLAKVAPGPAQQIFTDAITQTTTATIPPGVIHLNEGCFTFGAA